VQKENEKRQKQAYRHPFEFISPRVYLEAGSDTERETQKHSPDKAFFVDDEQHVSEIIR